MIPISVVNDSNSTLPLPDPHPRRYVGGIVEGILCDVRTHIVPTIVGLYLVVVFLKVGYLSLVPVQSHFLQSLSTRQ